MLKLLIKTILFYYFYIFFCIKDYFIILKKNYKFFLKKIKLINILYYIDDKLQQRYENKINYKLFKLKTSKLILNPISIYFLFGFHKTEIHSHLQEVKNRVLCTIICFFIYNKILSMNIHKILYIYLNPINELLEKENFCNYSIIITKIEELNELTLEITNYLCLYFLIPYIFIHVWSYWVAGLYRKEIINFSKMTIIMFLIFFFNTYIFVNYSIPIVAKIFLNSLVNENTLATTTNNLNMTLNITLTDYFYFIQKLFILHFLIIFTIIFVNLITKYRLIRNLLIYFRIYFYLLLLMLWFFIFPYDLTINIIFISFQILILEFLFFYLKLKNIYLTLHKTKQVFFHPDFFENQGLIKTFFYNETPKLKKGKKKKKIRFF